MFVPTSSATSRMPRRLFALAAAAAITLAGCGDDDDDTPAAAAATDAPAAATDAPATTAAGGRGDYDYGETGSTATTAAAPAGGDSAVMVAETGLGEVLVADNGMTLYLFVPDAQGAPTCTAACAEAWPPLTVADAAAATAGEGADSSLIGTATHPEAGTQVTYNGWPLYFFAGDSAPGDTNGEGQGGVWYVLDPTGNTLGNG
jgi:predicted lipoprotein with Yx(FWY)xxD motif